MSADRDDLLQKYQSVQLACHLVPAMGDGFYASSRRCQTHCLWYCRLPFDDGNVGRLFRAIKAGAFTLPTHLSAPAHDLLRRMLMVDPLRRITIEEIR